MTEPLIMALLVAGPACWLLGGYRWKAVRRFIWPVLIGLAVFFSGAGLLKACLLAAATSFVCLLPYGDRTPWPVKVLVFLAIPAPALILNLWAFPAVLVSGGLIFGGWYWSQRWQAFTWKIVEGLAGFLQAAALVIGLLI